MTQLAHGLYLALEHRGDHALGPYDQIVLRGASAIGERAGFGRVIAMRASTGEWRDVERDGERGDDAKTEGDLRITASGSDLLVRFSEDEVAGQPAIPDLGPFTGVSVGSHAVRADDRTLAVRISRMAPWQLTDAAGAAVEGMRKDALVFAPSRASDRVAPVPEPVVQAPMEEPAPSVWVDRVRATPEIYISRPDKAPKR